MLSVVLCNCTPLDASAMISLLGVFRNVAVEVIATRVLSGDNEMPSQFGAMSVVHCVNVVLLGFA